MFKYVEALVKKETKKMKFKIFWLEYFETKKAPEIKYLPLTHKHTGYLSGYGEEFECWDFFKAENVEEAKKIVEKDYEIEFFTVFDEKGNRLFTEEDINLE